jgi:hypothetical protein
MTNADPTVDWQVPTPAAPLEGAGPSAPRSTPRALRAVVWIVGIGFLLFLSRIAWIVGQQSEPDPSSSAAYGTAFVVGGATGVLLVAALLRWLYLRARRRPGSVLSPWLIGIACVWLLLGIVANANKPVAAVDTGAAANRVAERLQIASPYRLAPAGEEAKKALLNPIAAQGARMGYRGGDIRAIEDGSETVGYLIVLDVTVRSGDAEDYVAGFLESASGQGGTARREEIAGQRVGIVATADATLVSWVEVPLIVMVVGFDESSALAMTRATLTAP